MYGISVVIPTAKNDKLVFNLLEDLSKQEYPKSKIEIIVVDYKSEKNYFKKIREKAKMAGFKKLKIVRNASPLGFARDIGCQNSSYPYILMTDCDIKIKDKKLLKKLVVLSKKFDLIVIRAFYWEKNLKNLNLLQKILALYSFSFHSSKINFHLKEKLKGLGGFVCFFSKKVWKKIRFKHIKVTEDSDFVARAKKSGIKIKTMFNNVYHLDSSPVFKSFKTFFKRKFLFYASGYGKNLKTFYFYFPLPLRIISTPFLFLSLFFFLFNPFLSFLIFFIYLALRTKNIVYSFKIMKKLHLKNTFFILICPLFILLDILTIFLYNFYLTLGFLDKN